MDAKQFTEVVEGQYRQSWDTLVTKAKEYATDEDRLRNFKKAANLQDIMPREALGGMLAKHLISVYDLISNPNLAPQAVWDEKLGDAINYLLLLKAMVVEEQLTRTVQPPVERPQAPVTGSTTTIIRNELADQQAPAGEKSVFDA